MEILKKFNIETNNVDLYLTALTFYTMRAVIHMNTYGIRNGKNLINMELICLSACLDMESLFP